MDVTQITTWLGLYKPMTEQGTLSIPSLFKFALNRSFNSITMLFSCLSPSLEDRSQHITTVAEKRDVLC